MDYNKLIEQREIVSKRIESILKTDEFILSIDYLRAIHKYLFKDILDSAGMIRTDNLKKREDILNGESVEYPDYHGIETFLRYDFDMEREINYLHLNKEKLIKNIADLASRIWLVHPFYEGNTRTTCVFIEKYLRHIGYNVSNDVFKENALYFRNALVVSNYYNHELHIHSNMKPLIKFFTKLLIDNNIELNEEDLYIKELFKEENKVKTRKK